MLSSFCPPSLHVPPLHQHIHYQINTSQEETELLELLVKKRFISHMCALSFFLFRSASGAAELGFLWMHSPHDSSCAECHWGSAEMESFNLRYQRSSKFHMIRPLVEMYMSQTVLQILSCTFQLLCGGFHITILVSNLDEPQHGSFRME